ncbi:hypothetical protein BS78_09G103500 [Paspalum vaginatum]|nr:hypothetical protein BS78_09G103500 [Paspalum vaginatum]
MARLTLDLSNIMAGEGVGREDWLHRYDFYLIPSAVKSKNRWVDTNGVFPMMSSAVLDGTIKNTPYTGSQRERWELYSQLSTDAKHEKVTRSMEMHACRNSTRQGGLPETSWNATPPSALTQ